jgi:hypothetical protein
MSLVLEDSPSGTGKILAKTFDASKVLLHGQENSLEIDSKDFCVLVLYFLTNTDLVENDPRLDLIEKVKSLKQIPGYALLYNNQSSSIRLGL